MLTDTENETMDMINNILKSVIPNIYICEERKNKGISVINKPVDLQIRRLKDNRIVMSIEVACVNTTQLVGEVSRLFYDSCPIKLLVLGNRNVPHNGKENCQELMARLYGQDQIESTPTRIVKIEEIAEIKSKLIELLLID